MEVHVIRETLGRHVIRATLGRHARCMSLGNHYLNSFHATPFSLIYFSTPFVSMNLQELSSSN